MSEDIWLQESDPGIVGTLEDHLMVGVAPMVAVLMVVQVMVAPTHMVHPLGMVEAVHSEEDLH